VEGLLTVYDYCSSRCLLYLFSLTGPALKVDYLTTKTVRLSNEADSLGDCKIPLVKVVSYLLLSSGFYRFLFTCMSGQKVFYILTA